MCYLGDDCKSSGSPGRTGRTKDLPASIGVLAWSPRPATLASRRWRRDAAAKGASGRDLDHRVHAASDRAGKSAEVSSDELAPDSSRPRRRSGHLELSSSLAAELKPVAPIPEQRSQGSRRRAAARMNTREHLDGVLVQWGDRLFYPRNRVVRVALPPHLSGSIAERAALIRQHIRATVVRRAPQVMVKVTGGRGMAASSLRTFATSRRTASARLRTTAASSAMEKRRCATWRTNGATAAR